MKNIDKQIQEAIYNDKKINRKDGNLKSDINATNKRFLGTAYGAILAASHFLNPVALTLTLKLYAWIDKIDKKGFGQSISLTLEKVSENTRHFLKRLNQKCFGRASKSKIPKKRKALKFVSSIEANNSGDGGYHIHAIVERPEHIDFTSFEKLICSCWKKTIFGNINNKIKEVYDLVGWLRYMFKQLKMNDVGLDISNLYLGGFFDSSAR